jgi:hypothetical protein
MRLSCSLALPLRKIIKQITNHPIAETNIVWVTDGVIKRTKNE